MPFKKGDVVEVVAGKVHDAVAEGFHYVVDSYNANRWENREGAVSLHGVVQWLCADRFKLVEQELVFAVGAEVERTGNSTILLNTGDKYTIETVYLDALGGVEKIKLEGINTSYHIRGFKVVKNAPDKDANAVFNPAEWIPQEGEKVFIIGKDQWHTGSMDRFVNDGIEYTISRAPGYTVKDQVRLDNHYVYDPRVSLRPVNLALVGKKPVPPKEIEDFREWAYEKQTKAGLGGNLCAYAFEEKSGARHNIPYICHARLSNIFGEIVQMAYGFRYQLHKVGAQYKESHKVYSNYIISQSPWKDAFITQDIDEAIEKDILMNVEVNRYMMAAACVALRSGMEYPDRPVIFKEMLDLGHNPHTCWLMSCAFSKDGKNKYSFNGWGGGHDVIDKHRVFSQVIKFFQTGYHLEKTKQRYYDTAYPLTQDPYRTHHGQYLIAGTIADSCEEKVSLAIGNWFRNNTKTQTVGQGWDKTTFMDSASLNDVATLLDKLIKGEA